MRIECCNLRIQPRMPQPEPINAISNQPTNKHHYGSHLTPANSDKFETITDEECQLHEQLYISSHGLIWLSFIIIIINFFFFFFFFSLSYPAKSCMQFVLTCNYYIQCDRRQPYLSSVPLEFANSMVGVNAFYKDEQKGRHSRSELAYRRLPWPPPSRPH